VIGSLVGDDIGAWLEDVYGEFVVGLPNNLSFDSIAMYNIDQDSPYADVGWPTFTIGGATDAMLPTGVCVLLTLRTGVKRVLGRKYFGPFTGNNLADGIFEDTLAVAVAGAADFLIGHFFAAGSGNSLLPGVLDKTGAFWAFFEAVASTNPAYQRRRRLGAGS
jgi:hypothetical protein